MAVPTAFPELNAVLDELVAGVTAILAENFCGRTFRGPSRSAMLTSTAMSTSSS